MSGEAVEKFQALFDHHLAAVRYEFPPPGWGDNTYPPIGPERDPYSIGVTVLAVERTCKELGFSPSRHTLGLYFQDVAVPKRRKAMKGKG